MNRFDFEVILRCFSTGAGQDDGQYLTALSRIGHKSREIRGVGAQNTTINLCSSYRKSRLFLVAIWVTAVTAPILNHLLQIPFLG